MLRAHDVFIICMLLMLVGTGALTAAPPAPTKADVAYGPSPHQIMDIYLPLQGKGPFPVLIWFGNLWAAAKHVPDVHPFFAAHCAVIGVEMRTMADAVKDKVNPPISYSLLDARRAVQYVRLHAADWNIDPDRIAVGGGSQGSLPALYVGCAGERADAASQDPVERVSTKVLCVGAWRSQPSIDPVRMQEWVPGVRWGEPALGCSFADSLKRREELLPVLSQWSPEYLLHKGGVPVYFQYNWGLTKPDEIKEMDYLVHSPKWGLGFQKMAEERGVTCYLKFPDHPSAEYKDMWDFLIKQLTAATK